MLAAHEGRGAVSGWREEGGRAASSTPGQDVNGSEVVTYAGSVYPLISALGTCVVLSGRAEPSELRGGPRSRSVLSCRRPGPWKSMRIPEHVPHLVAGRVRISRTTEPGQEKPWRRPGRFPTPATR
jgi:hypothetical protein